MEEIKIVRKLELLSAMVDNEIKREGSLSSFMVRSGLLRDILDELETRRAAMAEHQP